LVILGTMILAFGWFGFNPGSSNQLGNDMVACRVAVNTMLASATGMVACTLYMWVVYGKPDPSFMCNGMLAGLVAITAPCAFVTTWAACAIGAIAGILVIWSALFWEKFIKVDDPVGAVSVHGVNGAWGVLSLGIFADGSFGQGIGWNGVHLYKETATGAFQWLDTVKDMPGWTEVGVTGWMYGNPGQFYAEAIGVAANILWVFPTSLLFFGIYGLIFGNRVKPEAEIQGIDVSEMGVAGYINDDPKTPEGHLTGAAIREPRPATDANGHGRFVVMVQGTDDETVTQAWSDLCQPGQAPPPKDFLIVYPYMTTFSGTRFRFRGGDPKQVSASLERLLQGRIGGKSVRTAIEP
jgi:ammonia channel protein AmtB